MREAETTHGAATLEGLRRWATGMLREAGIDTPALDARWLMAAALGLSEAQMLARPEFAPGPERIAAVEDLIRRRCRREPVSRILGWREFYGRRFALSPATLDPRPESETLIEAVLDLVRQEMWTSTPIDILDVGTGTGCLLLTLLSELPDATGVGSDLDPAALEVARGNAARLGVAHRASWCTADLLENIGGRFHVLVANPPYVRSGAIATLAPEVRQFDPMLALDGGEDGLQIFRRLSAQVRTAVPDGWIVVEVGCDQADKVEELLMRAAQVRSADVRTYADVSGVRRCVAVRTRN